ncbi:small ribosomal subunit protein uS15m-like [Diadema antillarum]|uniref:small ribosomal subunit protein uS15m-like n=1 Tax=Diadema antillarum TaxID=105358 RepID=UPI003A8C59CD
MKLRSYPARDISSSLREPSAATSLQLRCLFTTITHREGPAERPAVTRCSGAAVTPRMGLLRIQRLECNAGSIGTQSRGLASKAHMKYAKKKKAPTDRFLGLDPSQPRLGFEKVKALEDADENVKKIFSLEFGKGVDLHRMRRKLSEDKLRHNPDARDDLGVKIATITEHIRALAPHVEANKKDSVNKVKLLNAIDRRRKMLKYLRKQNYDRFQQVLEELNLSWSPPPEYYRRQTRRATEKRAVVQEAYKKRKAALEEFEVHWRVEKLLEIAHLKEDLGKELTEEEREVLEKSREGDPN